MKEGDQVVVRRNQLLATVREVDDAHVTVQWTTESGGTETRVFMAYELDPYTPETKPAEVPDEAPKAKKSKR